MGMDARGHGQRRGGWGARQLFFREKTISSLNMPAHQSVFPRPLRWVLCFGERGICGSVRENEIGFGVGGWSEAECTRVLV